MNDQLIAAVVEEIAPELEGRAFGKVWQLGRAALAADFRLKGDRYLFVSAEPAAPRLHLVSRRVRDLERRAAHPSAFALALRKRLGGALLVSVSKDSGERVVRFRFEAYDAAGEPRALTLVAQLTGRTANLFLLGPDSRVLDSLRPGRGDGQEPGDTYRPPRQPHAPRATTDTHDDATPRDAPEPTAPRRDSHPANGVRDFHPTAGQQGSHASLSAALDEHYGRLEAAREFDARAGSALSALRREIERRRKLERRLAEDERAHGDAEAHKRAGDLLLANLATAERAGARVRLIDYFAEDAPVVELEIDERATLQEEAARRFALYARAKRAAQEIARRRRELRAELDALEAARAELERIAAARDAAALDAFETATRPGQRSARRPTRAATRGGGDASRASDPARAADPARGDNPAHADSPRGGPASDARAARGGAGGGRTKRVESAGAVPGARRYRSSDGYEILVGRAARDNDHLTFKVARPHDLWLHAADYPGSHVVVRNHARGAAVPQRTVHEAAQLAAHFSQARRDAKVAVNYAERKFVSKIKGGAPGLVRLASFRTLLVEPGEAAERVK
jgi:predicted ribosome quality control (RQC) complex YloA/Tae2 family protein